MASYKAYTILGIKPLYAQLFRMSGQLVEENDKLREYTSGLKEYLRHLKEINYSFKIETIKLRNSKGECKQCESLIKEVSDLRETLGKFTQGKKA